MEFEKLSAQIRTGRKKGVARQLRRDGLIPAVCYGRDMQPLSMSLDPLTLTEAVKGPLGRNVVIEMSIEGDGAPADPILVMLQDYQYHAVHREVLHADFLQVSIDREVHVQVPIELLGRAAGVLTGGILSQVFRELPVRCLPSAIPAKFEIDVSPLELGDLRKVSDLDIPDGVVIECESTQTLVGVSAPTVVAEADEEEEGEGEGEATEEGTEEKGEDTPSEE